MYQVEDDLLSELEACTLPADRFHRQDHVRAAWIYLTRFPILEAIERFSEALRGYATFQGKPDRYHETITWAYLLLIHARMKASVGVETWEKFAAANRDLLDWKRSILLQYYREETLASDFAREVFVMPDRGDLLGRALI